MQLRTLLERKSSSNVSEATVQLLKRLQIPVTATTVIEKVESHPDFPSLYSISDSLDSWNVGNAALRVEAQNLEGLPTPFVAHVHRGGGAFVLVNDVNGSVEIINERGKKETMSKGAFLSYWTNNVLLAEKNEGAGEKGYRLRRREELLTALRFPVVTGVFLLLIVIYAFSVGAGAGRMVMSLLLLTKLLGCLVTGLLLWFEVDKSNPLLQQICTGNKNTNCTAILSSKGAKIFSWLSWSEVGFFYFAGGFFYALLTPGSPLLSLFILSWLNLLALPYTLFSVFYQWRIAKQWCPLCLGVQALLLMEFAIGYFGHWSASQQPSITSENSLLISASFLLPVLFWMATRKVYYAAQDGEMYKKEFHRLKYNKEISTALLQKQKAISASTEGLGIALGNPAAKHTLVKVCNPYCGPCAKAHKVIDELIETGEVKVQIIFFVLGDEKSDRAAPAKHLMALYSRRDTPIIQQALDDWYNAEKKDYDVFKAKYPVMEEELGGQAAKLNKMKSWCEKTSISFTPTIFFNGYQLPDMYKLEDLKHLL